MKNEICILIIDDNPIDRECYKRLLARDKDVSYTIYETDSARDAIEYCTGGVPDCVLLDCHMPGMDGFEFLQEIAGFDGVVTIPVIMLTGQGNESIAVKAMKLGVKDYLVKKLITEKALSRSIRKALEISQDTEDTYHPPEQMAPPSRPSNWIPV